jgi:YD repeat-containing protein
LLFERIIMFRTILRISRYFQNPESKPRHFKPRRRRPILEELENRLAPATVSWVVDQSGDWNNAANWSTGSVPGAGDVAVINRSVAVTVNLSATTLVEGIQSGSGQTLHLLNGANLTTSVYATNDGTIEQDNNTSFTFFGALTNAADGVYDFQGDATLTAPGAPFHGALTNQGIFRKSGGLLTSYIIPTSFDNTGTIQANSGTLAIEGAATDAPFNNTSGTLDLSGGEIILQDLAVTNVNSTFILGTGSLLEMDTGTYSGTYTATGSGQILLTGVTVFMSGMLDFPTGMCRWVNGTINGNIPGADLINVGSLTISPDGNGALSESLDNYGAIVQTGDGTFNFTNGVLTNEATGLYDFRGDGTIAVPYTYHGTFTNLGVVRKSSGTGTTSLANTEFDNSSGSIEVQQGELSFPGASLQLDGSATVRSLPSACLDFSGNLLGSTTNADQFSPLGTVLLDGPSTAGAPQQLEVMSQDLGAVAAGFQNNFAYGTLALGLTTYVQLVDKVQNSGTAGAEALYVETLEVPAGASLDLNGFHVYTRETQIDGTILNGVVNQVPTAGPILFDTPTAGQLSTSGQVDNWTFFGRANQTVTIIANTGSQGSLTPLQPSLNFAQVQLVDPSGTILATASNSQSGTDAGLFGVQLPTDGTYTIKVQAGPTAPGSTGYYLLTNWDAPVHNSTLNLNQTVYRKLATPYAMDHWNFSAVAGEQVQFNLVNAGSSSIVFDLTGPNGYTAFSNASASSGLIDLATSGTYTLTAHTTGPGGSYAFQIQQTSVTPLTVNSPYQGTLAGSGQAQLFTITLTSPTALAVVLNDPNANDENEVYVSFGLAPTRDSYQFRNNRIGADQQLILAGQPGTYYILVYNNLVTAPGSNYTLNVESDAFLLTGLIPGQVGNSEPTTLLATGVFPLAYQSTNVYQIQFITADGTVYPFSPLYLSATSLTPTHVTDGTMAMSAMLAAESLPAGTYSVRVSDGLGDTQTLSDALTVTAGGVGVLQTSIIMPNPIGFHVPSTLYVKYSNVGTAPMPAPLLVVTAMMDGQPGAFLSLDSSLAGLGYTSDSTPAGFSPAVQFLASGAIPGFLEPGESETVPVYYAGWLRSLWDLNRPPMIFSVGELDTTNTQTIDWSSFKDGLRPGSINTAAWDAIFPILTANLGSTWGQYLQTLDNDAVYLAGIGEPTTDLSQLLSFEIEKANAAYTAQTLTSVTADSLPAPGLDLSFVQSFQQSISGRYASGILGFGWTTNWDIFAMTLSNGDVVIKNDGVSLFFSLQPNGSFAPQAGDKGTTLTTSNGGYLLTQPDGTVYQFNGNGTLNYVQDTHGNRITAAYNAQSQLVSLTHSNGEFLDFAYNANGQLQSLTDSTGRTETYDYDATGQFLTSYTDVYGTTNYTYITGQVAQSPAQNNALAQIAYADNTHLYFGYDSQGRLIDQHRDSGQEDRAWTYLNPGGYVVTDANQNQTTVYFNRFGATGETIDPLGNITRSYFDSNLDLTKVIGPGGATYNYGYDANGNLTSQTDALGLTTNFTYDGRNNLTSYTDAKGNTTNCAGPNSDRSFSRIKTVWISAC